MRLKGAYFIRCEEVIKDRETGEITELHCTYDPLTKSGTGFTGRKVKGTIQWVSADHAVKVDVNLYEKLLLDQEIPKEDSRDWAEKINPDSLVTIKDALLEPFVRHALAEHRLQFFRHGYYCMDKKCSNGDGLVFNGSSH